MIWIASIYHQYILTKKDRGSWSCLSAPFNRLRICRPCCDKSSVIGLRPGEYQESTPNTMHCSSPILWVLCQWTKLILLPLAQVESRKYGYNEFEGSFDFCKPADGRSASDHLFDIKYEVFLAAGASLAPRTSIRS